MKTNITRFFLSLLISAGIFATAFAGGNSEPLVPGKAEPVQVNVVKQDQGYVILRVNLNKQDGKTAMLRISDDAGEVLYTERIASNQHVRYIKVSPYEVTQLVVTYNTANGSTTRKYTLLTERQTTIKVEEVAP